MMMRAGSFASKSRNCRLSSSSLNRTLHGVVVRKRREGMAYFNRESRALLEILNNLQRAEKQTTIDHSFYEFGLIRYHIQVSPSDPEDIRLSVLTPPLSADASYSNGLPDCTLQDIRRKYSNFAEVIEPPREGFLLTLKLNFARLPRVKDRAKAINDVSSLQAVILSSQLKDILWNLGSKERVHATCKPFKLVYHPQEPFFVSRAPEKITAIFPMCFKDNSDVVLATSFFQVSPPPRHAFSKAPRCTWSPIPPAELRGENFEYLTTNGGFVSVDVFPYHVEGTKGDQTAWILLNFIGYVKYHVKCTRGFVQRRMRQRLETLAEVIQQARIKGYVSNKKLQSRKKGRKLMMGFLKLKKLKKGCSVFTDQIKRLRSRIKIKGFDRLRRNWFRVPRISASKKCSKLD
ncbi:actin-related protein 2/3 complex subunit 2B isoform X2 [Ananas comosus]|uniref:Actin-related protein 2/3 complex subunit 2B isoform X2 n=1 Tax=Ananas comosus TaxID=4615 RepID=A0A6P5ELP6_ANACO|nr:actin-related protein 2/3 complex subunit 2B isoform X2 [Ananas comosus]